MWSENNVVRQATSGVAPRRVTRADTGDRLTVVSLNLSSEHLLNVTGPTMTHHIVKLLDKSTAGLALTCTFIKRFLLSRPYMHKRPTHVHIMPHDLIKILLNDYFSFTFSLS